MTSRFGDLPEQADQLNPYTESVKAPVLGHFIESESSGFSRHYAAGSFSEKVTFRMPIAPRRELVYRKLPQTYAQIVEDLSEGVFLNKECTFKKSFQVNPPLLGDNTNATVVPNDNVVGGGSIPGIYILQTLYLEFSLPALAQYKNTYPVWPYDQPDHFDETLENTVQCALWASNVTSRILKTLKITARNIDTIIDFNHEDVCRMAIVHQAQSSGTDREYTSYADALARSTREQHIRIPIPVAKYMLLPNQIFDVEATTHAAQNFVWSGSIFATPKHSQATLETEMGEWIGTLTGEQSQVPPHVMYPSHNTNTQNNDITYQRFTAGDIGFDVSVTLAFVPLFDSVIPSLSSSSSSSSSVYQLRKPILHAEMRQTESVLDNNTPPQRDFRYVHVNAPDNMCISGVVLGVTDQGMTLTNAWCSGTAVGHQFMYDFDSPAFQVNDTFLSERTIGAPPVLPIRDVACAMPMAAMFPCVSNIPIKNRRVQSKAYGYNRLHTSCIANVIIPSVSNREENNTMFDMQREGGYMGCKHGQVYIPLNLESNNHNIQNNTGHVDPNGIVGVSGMGIVIEINNSVRVMPPFSMNHGYDAITAGTVGNTLPEPTWTNKVMHTYTTGQPNPTLMATFPAYTRTRLLFLDALMIGYKRVYQTIDPQTHLPGPVKPCYGPPTIEELLNL